MRGAVAFLQNDAFWELKPLVQESSRSLPDETVPGTTGGNRKRPAAHRRRSDGIDSVVSISWNRTVLPHGHRADFLRDQSLLRLDSTLVVHALESPRGVGNRRFAKIPVSLSLAV